MPYLRDMGLCLQCNKWVTQTPGKKKKEFCNATCRSNYRYAKNKKSGIRIVASELTPGVNSLQKLPPIIEDDVLSFEKLKKQVPPQKGYEEYYKEMEGAEELHDLERVGRQMEKSSLSWREKQSLKAHGQQIANKKFI